DAGPAVACTSTASYTALAAGSHTFTVTAIDPAGTVSAPASFTWTIDLTPPVATVSSGPPSLTNRTSATFTFSSSKTGSAFSCKLAAAAAATCTSPAIYAALASGNHSFTVTATDPAGNLSAPASFTWTIDITAPVVSITSAPAAVTNQTGASFGFSSTEAASTFSCQLDAAAAPPCTSPATYGPLADGSHTFAVTATDPAGNTSSPASSGWTIDTVAPVASITSAPPAITNRTGATF